MQVSYTLSLRRHYPDQVHDMAAIHTAVNGYILSLFFNRNSGKAPLYRQK